MSRKFPSAFAKQVTALHSAVTHSQNVSIVDHWKNFHAEIRAILGGEFNEVNATLHKARDIVSQLRRFQDIENRRSVVHLNDEQQESLFALVTGRMPEDGERLFVAIDSSQNG